MAQIGHLDWTGQAALNLARHLGIQALDYDGWDLRNRVGRTIADHPFTTLSAVLGVNGRVDPTVLELLPARARNILNRFAADRGIPLVLLELEDVCVRDLLDFRQTGMQTIADIALALHSSPAASSERPQQSEFHDESSGPWERLLSRIEMDPHLETREKRVRIGTAVLNRLPDTPLREMFQLPSLPVPIDNLPLFQRSRTAIDDWRKEGEADPDDDLLSLTPAEIAGLRAAGIATVGDICLALAAVKGDGPPAYSKVPRAEDPATNGRPSELAVRDTSESLLNYLGIDPTLDMREKRSQVGSMIIRRHPRTPLKALFPEPPRFIRVTHLPLFQRSRSALESWMTEGNHEGSIDELLMLTPENITRMRGAGVATVGDICLALDVLGKHMELEPGPDAETPLSGSARSGFGLVREAVKRLSERERLVYAFRRVRRDKKSTLEQIGKEFGCSRERVRQVEQKIRSTLATSVLLARPLLQPPSDEILGWNLGGERLGFPPRPIPSWDEVDETSIDEIAQHAILEGLGLRESSGYIAAAETWTSLQKTLENLRESEGMTLPMVRRKLESVIDPLDSEFLAALLLRAGLQIDDTGTIVGKPRTQQDAILHIFAQEGRPLTRDEVIQRSGLSQNQIRGILQRKGVFGWVGKGIFAPTSWGMPVYEGTEKALRDVIEEQGGAALIADVIHEVVKRFGCTEVSCKMYLSSSPLFQRQGEIVSLARDDQPINPGNPARQRRVYSDLQGGLVWAIDIDADALRGSGRGIPPSIAAALGASKLQETMLEAPGGRVTIKRSGIGLQLSSVRRMVDTFEGEEDDRILLRVRGIDDYRWDFVRRSGPGGSALALRMIGQAAEEPWPATVSKACWQEDGTLWRETLWDRNEKALLDVLEIPEEDPRGNVLNLDVLEHLLTYYEIKRADVARNAGLPSYVFNEDAGNRLAQLTSVETTLVVRSLAHLTTENQDSLQETLFGSA